MAALAVALLVPAAGAEARHREKPHAAKKRSAKLRPHRHRHGRERLADRLTPSLRARRKPPAAPPPATPPPALASVGVTEREFSLELSRPSVATGPVRFSVRNAGEDPHDLHVRPEAPGLAVLSFSELAPGETKRSTTLLLPGTYVLWCSLEGHEALGMRATLTVN